MLNAELSNLTHSAFSTPHSALFIRAPSPALPRSTGGGGKEHSLAVFRFMIEQPPLPRQSAAEAGERAIRADDSMARHDDRNRIRAVGSADSAAGPFSA